MTQPAECPYPEYSRRGRKPTKPGKPKKKSAKLRNAAHQRALDLIAARATPDPVQRRMIEDSLVRTWIDRSSLAGESGLQDLMWPEYRYMSPLERTELFNSEYIAAYRRAYAKHCDLEIAARKQPAESEFVGNAIGDMNCLWRARATADALGVPYDMYLDAVMGGKMGNLKWIEPPLPNQLYARVDPARLRDRPTPAEITARLYGRGWDARFFADAYRGDPAQEAALALLRTDVLVADDRATRLSMYMVERRAITEQRARAMFGDDLVDAAITVGRKPKEPVPSDVAAYQPPCFGYPQWLDTSPCRSCPFVRDCWHQTELVRGALIATTGTSDPRLDTKRKQNADRQRRWYAKHRRAPRS